MYIHDCFKCQKKLTPVSPLTTEELVLAPGDAPDLAFSFRFSLLRETLVSPRASQQSNGNKARRLLRDNQYVSLIEEELLMEWFDLGLSCGLLCLSYLLLFTAAQER